MREQEQAIADPPRRLCASELAERWNVKPRTAAELLRRMVAAGVAKHIGKFIFGRLSAADAFIAAGGVVEAKRGRP